MELGGTTVSRKPKEGWPINAWGDTIINKLYLYLLRTISNNGQQFSVVRTFSIIIDYWFTLLFVIPGNYSFID